MPWMGAVGAAATVQWFDEVGEAKPRITELAPADAPEGHGDEPSPAEPALTEVPLNERGTTGEAGEEQIEALRKIRRMGRIAFWLRWGTVSLTLIVFALVGQFAGLGVQAILMCSQLLVMLVMAVTFHLYVERKRQQVRGMLSCLSATAQEELLKRLPPGRGEDTRFMFAPLATELGFRDALPADAPTGRGDEPTP